MSVEEIQWTPWLDEMGLIVASLFTTVQELEEDPSSESAIGTTKIELHSAKELMDTVGLKTSTQTVYEIEKMLHNAGVGLSSNLVTILTKTCQKLSELTKQIRINKPMPEEIKELEKSIGFESILVRFGIEYRVEVYIKAEKSLQSARALSVYNTVKRIAIVNSSTPSEEDLFLDAKFDFLVLEITSREDPDEIQSKIKAVPSVERVQIEEAQQDQTAIEGVLSQDSSMKVKLSTIKAIENGLTVLSTHIEAIKSEISSTKGLQELASINRSFEMIQSDIRKMRKVPLNSITVAFPSMVKRLATQQGKNVELIVQGRFITLDYALANYLVDPMTQVLKNAVYHGIEDPKTRSKTKKSPIGKVVIKARTKRDRIFIQIRDDGQGVDIDKLKKLAKERGISVNEDPPMDELNQLLFSKGLSSKEGASPISGCGLGLHTTLKKIYQIGGNLSVTSEFGKGTTVTFELSDNNTLSKSLIFLVNNSSFGIPSDDVEFVQAINTSELTNINNNSASIKFREKQLPVAILHTIIGEMSTDQLGLNSLKILLICRGRKSLIGLLVDEIVDERLVSIKPLNPLLQSDNIFCGTITGMNGEVIMVVDPTTIM